MHSRSYFAILVTAIGLLFPHPSDSQTTNTSGSQDSGTYPASSGTYPASAGTYTNSAGGALDEWKLIRKSMFDLVADGFELKATVMDEHGVQHFYLQKGKKLVSCSAPPTRVAGYS